MKVLFPQAIIDREVILHVRKEDGHVHDLPPITSGFLKDPLHVLENAAALRFNVVGNDPALCIKFHPGYFAASAFARTYTAEEQ